MSDFYKLLRLKPGASIEEIKKAYKKFAFHFHPDRNEEKGDLFWVVKKAYDELIKDVKKKKSAKRIFPSTLKKKKINSKPARPANHDLSFFKKKKKKAASGEEEKLAEKIQTQIKEREKRKEFYLRRIQKIVYEKNRCKECSGYGVVPNRWNTAATCQACEGTGKKDNRNYDNIL